MKKTIFTGSGVAIVTPMYSDGSVNFEELGKLIDFHLASGTDAIISCGTTGESATLSHEEHCQVLDFTIKRVGGKIPVIAGTGSNNTQYAKELSVSAEKSGADALLLVTPYYNKTSQNGLVQHFTTIADAVNIPVILYNVPSRTGCNIQPQTYKILSEHPNIAAAKEANGDLSAVLRTRALCQDNLDIYSGEDIQTLPILACGGKGVISVFANILPRQMHELCMNVLNGNLAEAQKQAFYYAELMDALFMDVNPIPVKAAMNMMGYSCGECRLPLAPMTIETQEKLKTVLKKYQLV